MYFDASKILYRGGTNKNIGEDVVIDDNTPKPSTITYAPNTIMVQNGGRTINYSYTPSGNQNDEGAHTIAYEYSFGNPMDRKTAVNLKCIDTTGVNVSYYYSKDKINTASSLTGELDFSLQQLEVDAQIYIYVIVSPTDEKIPVTFTQSIVWYYGIPKQMPIVNPVDNTVTYQTIVDGQKIDKSMFVAPPADSAPTGYYFDAFYLDKEYTKPLTNELVYTDKVYAHYANLPTNRLVLNGGEYTVGTGSAISGDLIIPAEYNGIKVTKIGEQAFINNTSLNSVQLPYTLTSIGYKGFYGCTKASIKGLKDCENLVTIEAYVFYNCLKFSGDVILPNSVTSIGETCFSLAPISGVYVNEGSQLRSIGMKSFTNCSSLKEVDLSNSELTSIEAEMFWDCAELITVILPNSVKNIEANVFRNNYKLSSINMPSQLTTIGDYAFYYCSELVGSITIPASVTKIGVRAFRSAGFSEIKFANTSGWYYTSNSDYTGGTSILSSNLTSNSTKYLKETYYSSYWYKVG